MSEPDLNPCNNPGYIKDLNTDQPPPYCREREGDELGNPIMDGQKDVAGPDLSWMDNSSNSDTGLGASALCDPILKGHIINDQDMSEPDPNTVYRYGKTLRGTHEAMQDLFRDVVVLDKMGKSHNVPLIWGTQEKAVAFIMQENVRQDESLVVERTRLPAMAIHSQDMNFDPNRYTYHKAIDYLRTMKRDWKPGFTIRESIHERDTVFGVTRGVPVNISYRLYLWTMYEEDMLQILEQVLPKISPMGYIRVRGISWEVAVKLDSISNNVNYEPGDRALRVFKYEIGMTAETFISQPIVRKKAVLKTKMEIMDSPDGQDVLQRLEESIKELEDNND